MGIEELLEELEMLKFSGRITRLTEQSMCYNEGVSAAITLINRFRSSLPTQQDKAVVPEFVAEWIDHCRECSWNLRSAISFENFGNFDDKIKLKKWFLDGKGKTELFARAWLDGYTVEKEQLHWIYDPIADQYLGYDRITKNVWWLLRQNDGARAELTDVEISKIGEQYRIFAVPVEEEE